MTIAPDIQKLLPAVLINDLYRIIASETKSLDAAMMECKLEIGKMGGRPIQQIELWGKRYIAYGFPPVSCKLLALVLHGQYKLYFVDG